MASGEAEPTVILSEQELSVNIQSGTMVLGSSVNARVPADAAAVIDPAVETSTLVVNDDESLFASRYGFGFTDMAEVVEDGVTIDEAPTIAVAAVGDAPDRKVSGDDACADCGTPMTSAALEMRAARAI